jgi:Domain of unknown function DUF29
MTAVPETARLYEEDFYAWTRAQADALRRLAAERWNGPLDLEHLAEEVEDLGRSQRHAVESLVERILEHLLKLEYSPAVEPRCGWLVPLLNARTHASRLLTAAIRREVEPRLAHAYGNARRVTVLALWEHGEVSSGNLLPEVCPYTFDQALDDNWFPQNQHGLIDRFT